MINHFKTEEYWLVFYKSNAWYGKYLKKDFSHCVVITRDKFNWILMDPMDYALRVVILAYSASDPFPSWIARDYNVLKVTKYLNTKKFKRWPLIFASCVLQVQYAINLNMHVLTPHRLYSKLCKLSQAKMKKLGIISVDKVKE